ncbi:MAG: hypothetical protein U1C53_01685 [Candidatus Veblenbacteria bacterium]|nr:hypothetical protein [Candidatus Veblenbacteria bacterium]MDZ4229825.1 hypothetical protein [Candidatus Veblenbacteria bacterium]
MKRPKRGTFIVIEGTDGSGKGTQFKLLVAALRRAGKKVATLDFPQYGKPSAYFIEQYLNGKYGKNGDVSPYEASLFYSFDRYAAKRQLVEWLREGRVVVANRFTLSNAAHQGGKIQSDSARRKYWQWLFNLEFNVLGLPRPDVTIFLHMPAVTAQKLVLRKAPRRYLKLGVKKDIHEADLRHLKAAEKQYVILARKVGARTVECVEKGRLLTSKEIHNRVLSIIIKLL